MADPLPPTIAVVGGGITGLAAAHALASENKVNSGIVLLEASERLGGKIRTERFGDTPIEAGPDSFVAQEQWATRLCEELQLGDQLIAPAVFGAYVWSNRKLHRLPQGLVYGMPSSPAAVFSTGVLSLSGALRALGDIARPGRLAGPDVSVAELVKRRFGKEVLERLVDPLLAGTRAGGADQMSLAAAVPQIDAVARRHRSVMLGLHAARRRGEMSKGPPPFLGLKGGMEQLVERLKADLKNRVELRTGARMEAVRSLGSEGYALQTTDGTLRARAVVLTMPAFEAARALRELNPRAAEELDRIEYASAASIGLVYPAGALVPPPQGSGFLVPSSEGRTIAACTWVSTKWPHLARNDGGYLIRCFVGRTGAEPVLDLDDHDLMSRAHSDVREIMGVTASPLEWRVDRWERGLPIYAVGHHDRVGRIRKALKDHPGIALAGAAYAGSGIPDCIRQAREAVSTLLRADLGTVG